MINEEKFRKTCERYTRDELITFLINRINKLSLFEQIIENIREYEKNNPNKELKALLDEKGVKNG